MPLSTSNSDGRAAGYFGGESWSAHWLAVVSAVVLLLLLWETAWRLAGFQPSITDDWPLWSSIRREANGRTDAVALVGSSRILLGLDPAVLEEESEAHPFMLAIDGSNPLPVLAHLAEDEEFIGSVICSLTPYWLAGSTTSREDRSEEWLAKFREQPLSSRIENVFASFVQSHLAFRSGSLAPGKLLEKWLAGESVSPPYAPMRPDRFRPADFSKVDLSSLRDSRKRRTLEMHRDVVLLSDTEFRARIKQLQSWVDKIRARGGEVTFVRFPSCGGVREIEEETIPRHDYWDVFAREIDASAIHFEDYPHLDDFRCTDGSHLDHRDAAHFTREIASLLQRRGFSR